MLNKANAVQSKVSLAQNFGKNPLKKKIIGAFIECNKNGG